MPTNQPTDQLTNSVCVCVCLMMMVRSFKKERILYTHETVLMTTTTTVFLLLLLLLFYYCLINGGIVLLGSAVNRARVIYRTVLHLPCVCLLHQNAELILAAPQSPTDRPFHFPIQNLSFLFFLSFCCYYYFNVCVCQCVSISIKLFSYMCVFITCCCCRI